MRCLKYLIIGCVVLGLFPSTTRAEILAMLNYESKAAQTDRREGIAVIDVDPDSENFSRVLMDIPLPYNLVNHHIYYNRDMSKIYVTALGMSKLHIVDMKSFPYRMKAVEIPECKVLEDATFKRTNRSKLFHFPSHILTGLPFTKILIAL
jgi:hypothetical protein